MLSNEILLLDQDIPEMRILTRFRPFFTIRTGILNVYQRTMYRYPGKKIFYLHPDPYYEKNVCRLYGIRSLRDQNPELAENISEGSFLAFKGEIIRTGSYNIFKLPEEVLRYISEDLSFVDRSEFITDPEKIPGEVMGTDLYVHKTADIMPGSVFDSREGPIIIEEGCKVAPFSFLQGPVYIGAHSHINSARISGGCLFGIHNRIGGEVNNSIFGDYSNKNHEGFVGNSIIGDWVNLGALTTTSNLKNNYGEVRMEIPVDVLPAHNSRTQTVYTGKMKFGSLIGDCSKTAIGTMLNTGTAIDAACNIFEKTSKKYIPPFSWGTNTLYKADRFISDCRKIFARRHQGVRPEFEELVERIYPDLNYKGFR